MGNRALVTTKDQDNKLALYLQWNGGRDSVEPFVRYCELRGFRSPTSDPSYAFARLTQVVGNFFGGSLSVGICALDKSQLEPNNYDNGIYYLDGWKIVDRDYPYDNYEEQDKYDFDEMLKNIDKAQPKKEQLGEILDAKKVAPKDLKIGHNVYVMTSYNSKYRLGTVIGFGEKGKRVNGSDMTDVPYVNLFGSSCMDFSDNCNNDLTDDEYFVKVD